MGLISRVSSRTYRKFNPKMRSKKEFEAAVTLRQAEIIKNFDDNELRVRCKENGLKCGPIPTPAIRKSWARRLAQKLVEEEMSQVEESSSGSDYEESEQETMPEYTKIPEKNTIDKETDVESDEKKVDCTKDHLDTLRYTEVSETVESSSSWLSYIFVFFLVSAFTSYIIHKYGNLL